MKVLAVIALLAVVAYAMEEPEEPRSMDEHIVFNVNSEDFVGKLQDEEGGPIHEITRPVKRPVELPTENVAFGLLPDFLGDLLDDAVDKAVPSCNLGKKVGNPLCLAKCVFRHHKGGYCRGEVCQCVDKSGNDAE